MKNSLGIVVVFILIFTAINAQKTKIMTIKTQKNNSIETATFAGGCFWCTEAIFQELKGVKSVVSGYSGGIVKNPAYREVVTGSTGHAEAIQITFNPKEISFIDLLDVFFSTHNPTTLNQQGYDVGTQYRSVVFYHNDAQKEAAEKMIKNLTKTQVYDAKIVTEVVAFTDFYMAEEYHQDYYTNNKNQPYCENVINPKLRKFLKNYATKLKE
ncbi:MAG: peptide-methionine (S)-S-oxide reductase MsrA [Flavobacteriales bacterium]|nr:peptide-methionine (S)-S-oxide reductase MsrA [Flavobacteriales bacterium]